MMPKGPPNNICYCSSRASICECCHTCTNSAMTLPTQVCLYLITVLGEAVMRLLEDSPAENYVAFFLNDGFGMDRAWSILVK